MANENNNINELLADDDDPTVELKSPAFPDEGDELLEADEKTFDSERSTDRLAAGESADVSNLRSELDSRQETIDRLQFDLESLRAKWLGMESEVEARGEQTKKLNDELDQVQQGLSRKEKLIKKRDTKIKALKSEIRQRDKEFRELKLEVDELRLVQSRDSLAVDEASGDRENKPDVDAHELWARLSRSEEYADAVRQQAQDRIEANRLLEREVEALKRSLAESRESVIELSRELHESRAACESVQDQLDSIQDQHEEEMRILRFELGEARDTIVESSELTSQLTSDLIDARTFKEELERCLGEAEEKASQRTEQLQRKVRKLSSETEKLEQKLNTKSEAITVLLAELAKKSAGSDEQLEERSLDSTDIDYQTPLDRVSRVLIGTVEGQVLRFPLFKNRLTIGRTKENDIQLKAAYISRQHAIIQTVDERTSIIDRGSKNGIQVNAEKTEEQVLHHGDTVTIGNAKFKFEERKKRD